MQVNGVIEKIWYGTPKDGEYGKSCPCAITVNNTRYSCFVKEFNGTYKLQKKTDSGYLDINEGMQVIFEATQKGEYFNFKTTDLMILNSGGTGTNPPPPTQQPTQQQNVASAASNVPSADESLDMFCRGVAEAIASYKLKGKNMPDESQILRAADLVKKTFFAK